MAVIVRKSELKRARLFLISRLVETDIDAYHMAAALAECLARILRHDGTIEQEPIDRLATDCEGFSESMARLAK